MKLAISFALLSLILGWALSSGADPKPREFGPEWTKVGDGYVKKAEVEWSNNRGGYSRCELALSQGTLHVTDFDAKTGYRVWDKDCGEWEVQKDGQGKVKAFRMKLNSNIYFDIDGDGIFDGFYDGRAKHEATMIVFEGRHVQVEDRKNSFTAGPGEKIQEWGYGRKERYEFDGGKWKLLTPPAAQ